MQLWNARKKIEIRAYIKARVAWHITLFSELCRIHGSSTVTFKTVFRWFKKKFKKVNVVLSIVTVQAGLWLQQQRKILMAEEDGLASC